MIIKTILNLYKKGVLSEDEAVELIENLKVDSNIHNFPITTTQSTEIDPWKQISNWHTSKCNDSEIGHATIHRAGNGGTVECR